MKIITCFYIFDKFNNRIIVGDGAPQWYQYFLCGIKGILNVLPENLILKGLKVVVNGDVPQSAGLSSSSALVSAAALAMAHANNVRKILTFILLHKICLHLVKLV